MDVFIDPRFEDVYRRQPLVLVDAGARGGLKSGWLPARRHLKLIGFEPDKREFARLTDASRPQPTPTTFFGTALHNRRETVRLTIARDRGLSSIFEPDREFLDRFPDADRFETIDVQQMDADTLDNLLAGTSVDDVDFVKADTQGSELYVLEGASRTLRSLVFGVEVEVEFAPIYKGQPLFADVDPFLRGLGFQLFDLRPCYWKRTSGRGVGGPRGQIIWADALYLKSVPAVQAMIAGCAAEWGEAKVLKAISVSVLYGYLDYAIELARHSSTLGDDARALIERRIRDAGARRGILGRLPGRRQFASALRRLLKVTTEQPEDAWSVGRAHLGNDW